MATSEDISTIKLMLEKHFAENNAQISAMRAENAEFKEQIKEEFRKFRDEVKGDINDFKKEVNTRFDGVNVRFDSLQAQMSVMQNDITGLKHDVNNLFHWDYWILAIIVAAFAMPHIIESIKSLFGAVRDGIAGILSLFKGGGNDVKH